MNVVFVFAHQDDEIAFASRIRYALRRGDRVDCVCLTDGAFQVATHIRDEESRIALAKLGAPPLIVATENRIPDGKLPEHLDEALAFLDCVAIHADEIVTLAWEGGHQDHDAASLVAAVFAQRRGIPCVEMPLYNGHRTRGRFFRVFHPVGDGWTSRRITIRERLHDILLTRVYRSQRKSWLGLTPQMLFSRPRELTRSADPARCAARPHAGSLLYERRFRYPYERFADRASRFLQARARRD